MADAADNPTGTNQGRVPPHNNDAEEGLIASCIIDPGQEVLSMCMEARLRPDSFFKPAHQVLYQVMLDLYDRGNPVDEVVLLDSLSSRTIESIGWLKERQRLTSANTTLVDLIGGAGIIASITNRIDSTAHARHWLEIVREKWLLRRLIQTANSISEQAYLNQDQLDHFVDMVEQQILSINEDRIEDSTQSFDVAIDAASALINRILQGDQESGVMTGYTDVDKLTFGLHAGEMVVLAARPSMGKTSFGMNIAENVALPPRGDPKGVLVFSMEMPAEQLGMRMLCGRARINLKRVRDRMINKEQVKELVRVASELRKAPVWVDDSSGMNILEIRAKARRIHKQHPLELIVVDYLQLISGTDARVPREQQISEISRGIKAMAKELGVPVLVLSQLNRSSEKENRPPRLSDLRESGAIEQDADVVFLLAPGKKSEDNPHVPQASHERELIIAKQRNGPTGEVPLTFIPDYTRFENYTREPQEYHETH